MHVVVATCAHRGDDARIVHRQARSLLEAGHQVTLVAPYADGDPPGLVRVDVPRAVGRRRWRAWRATRKALAARRGVADVLLVHDPELLAVVATLRWRAPIVWDVHEDFVASVGDRRWIPRWARPAVVRLVLVVERVARRRVHLLLAEDAYAERLGAAAVVPNSTWVPTTVAPIDEGRAPRVVYVGRISASRGVSELVALGRRLRGRVDVVLIGDADADVREQVGAAARAGDVTWLGYRTNPEAMAEVDGALAGLSLLHDEANYRHSRPTELVEYLAHGVPVVTTPLPLAVELVRESGGGAVVPFGDVEATVDAVERLLGDRPGRDRAAQAGHAHVLAHFSWQADGARFVRLLEGWAAQACGEAR